MKNAVFSNISHNYVISRSFKNVDFLEIGGFGEDWVELGIFFGFIKFIDFQFKI